jgi:hypothetical protein
VTTARVVAHIALLQVLDGLAPQPVTAGYDVDVDEHAYADRGSLGLACGRVTLVHRRTRRSHRYVYAALHLGALEVVGGCRPAGDAEADATVLAAVREAFATGTRLTRLLRLVTDGFGLYEFDISAALPDAPDRLLRTAARSLADRFGAELERLFTDHRAVFSSLASAGQPLPDELRAPAQLALARRLEADLIDVATGGDRLALASAKSVVAEALDAGVRLDVPLVRTAAATTLDASVSRAVDSRDAAAVDEAIAVLDLARHAGVPVDYARAQEAVYDTLTVDGAGPLVRLGAALGLAVGHLGVPS